MLRRIQFFPSNKNSILIIIAREEWQIGKESKQVKNGPSLFIFYVNQSICHILKTMEWRNAHKKTETPSLHQILLVFFVSFILEFITTAANNDVYFRMLFT